jgi:predicted ATPase
LKLSRISIKNYRGIREADVTLTGGISTLVGKNNAGKSSFIDAILFASELGQFPANQAHPDAPPISSRGGLGAIGFRGVAKNRLSWSWSSQPHRMRDLPQIRRDRCRLTFLARRRIA